VSETSNSEDTRHSEPFPALFRRLLFRFGQREAFRFLAACFAFLGVISALTVSHSITHLAFDYQFTRPEGRLTPAPALAGQRRALHKEGKCRD
jgi:hypothetical protein